LQKKHIAALKEVLRTEYQEFQNEGMDWGVSFEAFKALQKLLIHKLKQQTCWKTLRHFGFDDNLKIQEQILNDDSIDL